MTEVNFKTFLFNKITLLTTTVIVGVFADWLTKLVARSVLSIHEPLVIFPGFNLSLNFNRGIALGLFPAESVLGLFFLISCQLIIVAGILYMFFRTKDIFINLYLAIIVAGALGNLLDRILLGRVTDFFDAYLGDWHWPAFNMADIFISVGIMGLMITEFFPGKKIIHDPV